MNLHAPVENKTHHWNVLDNFQQVLYRIIPKISTSTREQKKLGPLKTLM